MRTPDPYIVRWYDHYAQAAFGIEQVPLDRPVISIGDSSEYRGFNRGQTQPYHLEVWIEKATMNDILIPVCRDYHSNLVTGEGQMSITSVWDLVSNRIKAISPTPLPWAAHPDRTPRRR